MGPAIPSRHSLVPHKSSLKDLTKGKTPSKEYDLKKVLFHEIHIREFPQILGDNPAVSEGAPLTLAWKYQQEYKVNVSIYEYTRAPMRRTSRKKLMISAKRRVNTLIAAGYSIHDIGDAISKIDKAKAERLDSIRAVGWKIPLVVLTGAVETTASALGKLGQKSSKAIIVGVTAAMGGMGIRVPKRKSVSNPAC